MSKTFKRLLLTVISVSFLFGSYIPAFAFSRTVDKNIIRENVDNLIDYIYEEGYYNSSGNYAIAEDYSGFYKEGAVVFYDAAQDMVGFNYRALKEDELEVYVRMWLDSPKSSYGYVELGIFSDSDERYISASSTFDISTYDWEDTVYFIEQNSNYYEKDLDDLGSGWLYGALTIWNRLLFEKPGITLHALGFVTLCKNHPDGHNWKTEELVKGSFSDDGYSFKSCYICGETENKTLFKIASVNLSDTKPAYTGKAVKPKVTVKDRKGKTIASSNYSVKYSNNVKIGTAATATVTFKGNYEGSKKLKFTISPDKVTGLKACSIKTTSVKLSWNKALGAKYYKVERSADGKKWSVVTTTSANNTTITKLKTGTKYQFRVTSLDSTKKYSGKVSSVLKTGTLTAAPSLTLKSAKSKTVTATWKKVAGANKYIIYKSSDGKKWVKVKTTTTVSYTLTKLSGGKNIYVKVCSVNLYGKLSAFSATKKIKVKK